MELGSVRRTQPMAGWPPCDNERGEDKGKNDASGTLLVDGGGKSPPRI